MNKNKAGLLADQPKTATVRIDHDNYIELIFQEASHQAVDDLVAHLLNVIDKYSDEEVVRLFINNGDLLKGQPILCLLA